MLYNTVWTSSKIRDEEIFLVKLNLCLNLQKSHHVPGKINLSQYLEHFPSLQGDTSIQVHNAEKEGNRFLEFNSL